MKSIPFQSANSLQYKNGRYSLLVITALSFVNIFLIIFLQRYFVFSAYIPQALITIGYFYAEELSNPAFTVVFGVIASIVVVPYLLCFIFSKKKVGWMIGALVFFSIDSAIFLFDFISLLMSGEFGMILDLVFRVWALITLILGVKYGIKVNKEESEPVAEGAVQTDTMFDASQGFNSQTDDFGMDMTRELTISRKKSFTGSAVKVIVYANGKEICSLKNRETKSAAVPCSEFELAAMLGDVSSSEKISVAAGETNLNYSVTIKTGFAMARVILEPVTNG